MCKTIKNSTRNKNQPQGEDVSVPKVNPKFKPLSLMTLKQMLIFSNEKNLPIPPEYCNPVVQSMFLAQNIARTHPKLFTKRVLVPLANRYEQEIYHDMSGHSINTIEGVDALNNLINDMQTGEPVMPLEWNRDLAEAAKDHVKDIGK